MECQRSSAGTAITPQPLPVAQPLGGDGVSGVGFDDNDQVWGRDGCSAVSLRDQVLVLEVQQQLASDVLARAPVRDDRRKVSR